MNKVKQKENPIPVKPKIKRFFAKYASYYLPYRVIDKETGEPAMQTNLKTGQPLYDRNGNRMYITQQERFEVLEDKMSKGFLSVKEIDVNDKDPQNQEKLRVLTMLAERDDPDVVTEEQYQKKSNFAAWQEKQKAKETLERAEAAEAKAKALEEKLKAFEEKK